MISIVKQFNIGLHSLLGENAPIDIKTVGATAELTYRFKKVRCRKVL